MRVTAVRQAINYMQCIYRSDLPSLRRNRKEAPEEHLI